MVRAPGLRPRPGREGLARSRLAPADHPFLEPRHFVDEKAVNENHEDYMFLECILFITQVSARSPGGCGCCAQAAGPQQREAPQLAAFS